MRTRTVTTAALVLALVASVAGTAAGGTRHLPGTACPVFPADNYWHADVRGLPVHPRSDAIVRSIGASENMHADFGSGLWEGAPIGIPITYATKKTPRSRVSFDYADESDKGPYPIPRSVAIEGGRSSDGDRHALIVDRDTCTLYELYALHRSGGGWAAGSGAIWSLRSNKLRPAGWTSADAAGLPIFPGLARYDEVDAGAISHALRFTAPRTRRAYIYPARHFASDSTDPSLPPMGLRVRLKASFDTRGFPPQTRVVLEALKRYGMILADNGSPWYVSGASDPSFNDDDLRTLNRITGADLEVVDTSALRNGP
jgi:hypothetical protein